MMLITGDRVASAHLTVSPSVVTKFRRPMWIATGVIPMQRGNDIMV
jgi:hypothetical protein